jgi:hypothetical protein
MPILPPMSWLNTCKIWPGSARNWQNNKNSYPPRIPALQSHAFAECLKYAIFGAIWRAFVI